MKLIIFILLAFSLCFAQPVKQTDIDNLKGRIDNLETKFETRQNEIKKSVDSLNNKFLSDNFISVKAAKETQELYNTSFVNIQTSFSIFTNKIIAIITIFSLFIGGFTIFISVSNSKQVRELKKEIKEEIKKLEGKQSVIETRISKTESRLEKFGYEFNNFLEQKNPTHIEKCGNVSKNNIPMRKKSLKQIGGKNEFS
jgi:flagellar biosynthesis protein FlhB